MGFNMYVCNCCGEAYSEYDESKVCNSCGAHFCEDCSEGRNFGEENGDIFGCEICMNTEIKELFVKSEESSKRLRDALVLTDEGDNNGN